MRRGWQQLLIPKGQCCSGAEGPVGKKKDNATRLGKKVEREKAEKDAIIP